MRKLLPFVFLAAILGCSKSAPIIANVSGTEYTIPAGWRDLTSEEMENAKKGFAGSFNVPGAEGGIKAGWTPSGLAKSVDEAAMMVMEMTLPTPIPEAEFAKNLIAGAPSMGMGAKASEHKMANGKSGVKIYMKDIPSGAVKFDGATLWWMNDGKVSILMYLAIPDKYESYIKDFESAVSSMKMK